MEVTRIFDLLDKYLNQFPDKLTYLEARKIIYALGTTLT